MPRKIILTIPVILVVATMFGCSSVPNNISEPSGGKVEVEITSMLPPPGGSIQNFSDIRIVKSANAIKSNTFSILTAAPRILLGGGGNVYLEKTEMYGESLMSVDGKAIKNPFNHNTEFAESIQKAANDFLSSSSEYNGKTFVNKIYITTGMTRLLYESLTGTDSEKYRLYFTMYAYKRIENLPSLLDVPRETLDALSGKAKPHIVVVKCDDVSKRFYSADQWLANDGVLLKEEIDSISKVCRNKIIGELPNFLNR